MHNRPMNSTITKPVIEVSQASKTFKNGVQALSGLSLQVRPGECFGLLGPNGAGKSTLISLIYGVAKRTGGDISVFGLDPHTQSREIKKRLGVVTQENALDEGLTVEENMSVYAMFVGLPPEERKSRVDELLDYMALSHKKDESIRALSGGMKRRLVFVRALLSDPDLIILDEPTTGLDPAVRHLLWSKVRELKSRGKTVLLTTHYMHEAEMLCDRIVIVNKGRIVAEGSPQQLIEIHTPGFVAAFNETNLAGTQIDSGKDLGFHVYRDSSGVYFRASSLNSLIDFQTRLQQPALQLRPANLEDVFLKLTGQELSADA